MTLPASVTTVTVTMRYTRQVGDATGVPCSGTVKFRTSATMTVPTDNMILPPFTTVATLDANGQASVVLCALDDPQILETGLTYQVTEDIAGAPQRNYDLALSTSQAPTVDLADIVPAVAQPSTITYLARSNNLSDVASVSSALSNIGGVAKSTLTAKGSLYVATAASTPAELAVGTAGYVPMADPAAASGLSYQVKVWDDLAAGATSMDRRYASQSPTTASGTIRFAYFTAARAETIANIAMCTSGTAAGATPTLCRMGVYSVAANGDLTLVGACTNDTSLFATINTRYVRSLSASYPAVLGQRYAIAVLVVTGAATPTFVGSAPNAALATSFATAPRVSATLAGQTDLASPITSGSLSSTTNAVYGEVLP